MLVSHWAEGGSKPNIPWGLLRQVNSARVVQRAIALSSVTFFLEVK